MKNRETIKHDVRGVIEEIDIAYHEFSNYSYMNADYANFARMAVGQFRKALDDPKLTREELEFLLRKGMIRYKDRNRSGSWSKFVASYMARPSNANNLLYTFHTAGSR